MPFYIWNDRCSEEIEKLDSNHRKTVGLINDLYDSIAAGVGTEVIEGIADQVWAVKPSTAKRAKSGYLQ